MKPNYLITALFSIVAVTEAVEVGETVNITKFVADGVYITGFVGEYTTVRPAASERFYDSEKGAPWTEGYAYGDSLMCWSHTAANLIQYWQSYYGIFY